MHPLAVAAALIVGVESAAPPEYDVFTKVLSPVQRAQITRDERCAPAKKATEQFMESKDPHDGVTAMYALEGCARLERVGDWMGYRDYLYTAAGAIAYKVGVIAGEPKAYERALRDLSLVFGYRAPNTLNVDVVSEKNEGVPLSSAARRAWEEQNAGLPLQNSMHAERQSIKVSGYAGTYGQLATEVGNAAELAIRNSRTPALAQPRVESAAK